MKLTDLEPQFIRYESRIETWDVIEGDPATWRERGAPTKEVTGPRQYMVNVESLTEADGITFLCPKCFEENGHRCEVTFEGRGAADDQGTQGSDGTPTRWNVSGSGLKDLTTAPSILLVGGCAWHGFITNGEVS